VVGGEGDCSKSALVRQSFLFSLGFEEFFFELFFFPTSTRRSTCFFFFLCVFLFFLPSLVTFFFSFSFGVVDVVALGYGFIPHLVHMKDRFGGEDWKEKRAEGKEWRNLYEEKKKKVLESSGEKSGLGCWVLGGGGREGGGWVAGDDELYV
jgi:hypothetical protein